MREKKRKAMSYLVARWERLLSAVAAHADDLQHVEECRAKLEAEVADFCATRDRRDALRAESQRATQDLSNIAERIADLASRLRAGVLLGFGRHSEVLSEFGIKAVRPPRWTRKRPARMPLEAGAFPKSHRTVK